ncbi:PTS-dependent dihydroxyacetone kinase 1, dihydroxyacetone-binding subunit DhaK-like [Culicoides brevitarsis]|uniref:PTS-dependent dihydroxyacetone kinase 1, dihydroxyacetone-binding subunit DhaK-like n=1 Tax=Culicoides brevitarsis TaxID=469753 RepID=UPI00307B50DC
MSDDEFSLTKVQKSLAGYVSINNNLRHYRKTNIVARNDLERMKPNIVRIITGGGSGHEPFSIGYVGEGMLTACVCGEIFASPSVTNILTAIVTAGARPGSSILLIVINYTGDRLNFGLAGEIARTKYGFNVETILVNDDCSIENVRKSVGKRGLAGAVLIHKIAGAMAAMGKELGEIADFCNDLLQNQKLATIGFTFTEKEDESVENIEIGRGIHGEPGIEKIEKTPNFERIVEIVMEKLLKAVPRGTEIRKPQVAFLFNNLGGATNFAISTFANIFLKEVRVYYDVQLTLEGTFVTSHNVEGMSVTILRLDGKKDEILDYLRFPVKIAANVPFNIVREMNPPDDHPVARYDSEYFIDKFELDERLYEIKHGEIGIEAAKKSLLGICDILIKCEKLLNGMDAEFGDGDTGTLITGAAKALLQAINSDKINFMYPAVMLHEISDVLQKNMGGSLGAIFCIFLQGAAEAFIFDQDVVTVGHLQLWLLALKFGMRAVMKYGLAEVGDRTILDALQPGIEKLEEGMAMNPSLKDIIDDFATACEEGADRTKEIMPKSGRAAYGFSEGKAFKAETNDPGAQVIGIIARATYEGIKSVFNKHNIE